MGWDNEKIRVSPQPSWCWQRSVHEEVGNELDQGSGGMTLRCHTGHSDKDKERETRAHNQLTSLYTPEESSPNSPSLHFFLALLPTPWTVTGRRSPDCRVPSASLTLSLSLKTKPISTRTPSLSVPRSTLFFRSGESEIKRNIGLLKDISIHCQSYKFLSLLLFIETRKIYKKGPEWKTRL